MFAELFPLKRFLPSIVDSTQILHQTSIRWGELFRQLVFMFPRNQARNHSQNSTKSSCLTLSWVINDLKSRKLIFQFEEGFGKVFFSTVPFMSFFNSQTHIDFKCNFMLLYPISSWNVNKRRVVLLSCGCFWCVVKCFGIFCLIS